MSRDLRLLAPLLFLTFAVAACAAASSPTPGAPTAQATPLAVDFGSAARFGRSRDLC